MRPHHATVRVTLLALTLTGCAGIQQILQVDPPKWKRNTAVLVGAATVALAFTQGNDKAAHCVAGAGSSLATGLIWGPTKGWVVSVGLGALKETSDANGGGTPEGMDFAATAACGTAAAAALAVAE